MYRKSPRFLLLAIPKRVLRFLALLPAVLPFFSTTASAQYTRGYAFLAPGGVTESGSTRSIFGFGGGVERLLDRGVGVGGELSALVPGQGPLSDTLGLFSLSGYYHLRSDARIDPFGSLGYSVLFRDFTNSALSWGGGVNYWIRDTHGLVFEFRDNAARSKPGPGGHFWEIRIGFIFR